MQRVILHVDRRKRSASGIYIVVVDGVPCASGERGAMIELVELTYSADSENVTHVTCVHCGRGA